MDKGQKLDPSSKEIAQMTAMARRLGLIAEDEAMVPDFCAPYVNRHGDKRRNILCKVLPQDLA